MRQIRVQIHVEAPKERVFDAVIDHETFLHDAKTRTTIVRPGAPDRNATGCLREVRGRGLRFVEEITACHRPDSFEYQIREATLPIRHHGGRLSFTANGGGTDIEWTSLFEIPTPFVGGLLARVAERTGARAFTELLVAMKRRLEAEEAPEPLPAA